MLRFRLKELIAEKEFEQRRRILIQEIAEKTGVTRDTISKLMNRHDASVRSETLNRLCAYFNCRIEELVEYVPDRDDTP